MSRVPIYGIYGTYVGIGAVGGSVIPFEQVATKTAQAGVRILRGETPASAVRGQQYDPVLIFDWRQMKRFGIKESDLPPGSVVRFRNLSLWARYRGASHRCRDLHRPEPFDRGPGGSTAAAAAGRCPATRSEAQARLAADAARESEARFRLIADAAPVLIWMSERPEAMHLLQQALAGFHRPQPRAGTRRWLGGKRPSR